MKIDLPSLPGLGEGIQIGEVEARIPMRKAIIWAESNGVTWTVPPRLFSC